jgi:predicted ATPase
MLFSLMSSTPNETERDDSLRIVPIVGRDAFFVRLPMPLTALLGRAREVQALVAKLNDPAVRLVTLTGAGGSGKTRLALEVASRLFDQFADGVAFVPLATLSDPDLIMPTIAHALGVRETGGRSSGESLTLALREREFLLVIDNLEQIVSGVSCIGELLTDCPHLAVLATSRERLRLRGEHVFPVAPLSLPAADHLPTAETLPGFAAVALFVERARQSQPDFVLTSGNAADVAAIC